MVLRFSLPESNPNPIFQLPLFQSEFYAVNSEQWDPAGRSGDLNVYRQDLSCSYTVTHFNSLMGFQDFYRSERSALGDFLLLPDTLDKWAGSHQKELLGYQEQANMFLSKRREGRPSIFCTRFRTNTALWPSCPVCLSEIGHVVYTLNELLRSLPTVLISIHEQQQRTKLKEDVDRVRVKLEETLVCSQKEKVSRSLTALKLFIQPPCYL